MKNLLHKLNPNLCIGKIMRVSHHCRTCNGYDTHNFGCYTPQREEFEETHYHAEIKANGERVLVED